MAKGTSFHNDGVE